MPQIVATPQPMRVKVVTIVAAINDPRAVQGKVRLKLSPRSQAITVPVQTPVIGRGIPTQSTKPTPPYFSTIPPRRLQRSNTQSANLMTNCKALTLLTSL